MTYIKVINSLFSEETSIPNDDGWDRANTSTTHYIEGFKVSEEYYDLPIDFTPEYDTVYFLLYGVYSTGDSFEFDESRGIEFLGLYGKRETADLNLERIEAFTDIGPITLLTDFGINYDIYIPWNGYFERLEYLRIDQIYRK